MQELIMIMSLYVLGFLLLYALVGIALVCYHFKIKSFKDFWESDKDDKFCYLLFIPFWPAYIPYWFDSRRDKK